MLKFLFQENYAKRCWSRICIVITIISTKFKLMALFIEANCLSFGTGVKGLAENRQLSGSEALLSNPRGVHYFLVRQGTLYWPTHGLKWQNFFRIKRKIYIVHSTVNAVVMSKCCCVSELWKRLRDRHHGRLFNMYLSRLDSTFKSTI